MLRIEGPLCTFSFCGDVEFQVLSVDGSTEVGKISKQWSGILREVSGLKSTYVLLCDKESRTQDLLVVNQSLLYCYLFGNLHNTDLSPGKLSSTPKMTFGTKGMLFQRMRSAVRDL